MRIRRGAQGALAAISCASVLLTAGILASRLHAQQGGASIVKAPEAPAVYKGIAQGVSASRLQDAITKLSSIHYTIPASGGAPAIEATSRMAGTPGGDQARDYVEQQFRSILGSENVTREDFPVTVPVERSVAISAAGHTYSLRTLWPNLVRTSTLPDAGIDAPLIDAGLGSLRAFNGKKVKDSIVLLDFNCGNQWLNAPRHGAKAVIFVEPTHTMRGEAEAKFIGIPISIPRFWISKADAAALRSAALTTPNLTVHLTADNPWETHATSNLLGVIHGSDPVLGKQIVVIEGYYDSMSVVPTLAPGAESACGMATLLELARTFHANPPKRTVWLLACGAHFIGLKGARTFIDKHLEEWQPISGFDKFKHSLGMPLPAGRKQVMLFSGLDLSSQSSMAGVFYTSYFYQFRYDVQSHWGDIGKYCSDNAKKISTELGVDQDNSFADGVNGLNGKGWQNYLPARFAFDSEVAGLASEKGITFATADDARQTGDTPADTLESVNISNVTRQAQMLACEYWNLLNDYNDSDQAPKGYKGAIMPVKDWPNWRRQGLQLGITRLNGRALIYDPKANLVPDTPVPGALAVVPNVSKTMVGVRGNLVEGTFNDPKVKHGESSFEFASLPLIISQTQGFIDPGDHQVHIAAYHIHDHDTHLNPNDNNSPVVLPRGDIDYAADQGPSGYPLKMDLTGDVKTVQVVVFPCVATSLYDLDDQQTFRQLTGVHIFDGASNGTPRQYGFTLATAEPGVSYVEDVAVLFSAQSHDPKLTTRFKVIMDAGIGANSFLLINSLPMDPHLSDMKNQARAEGFGYAVGAIADSAAGSGDPNSADSAIQNGAVANTGLRVAQDMWNLDDYRLRKLGKYRIFDAVLTNKEHNGLHDIAEDDIAQAVKAYQRMDYATGDAFSREAWGYEGRVYPQAQATASDVVRGVIFYLFLLIPFAYFLERLLFGMPDLRKQLGMVLLIFILIFFVFSQIHPAFDMTINPLIVLIAFVMLALSVLVSSLLWGKFEDQLKAMNRSISGVHKTDVAQVSVAMAAFSLGISNMRRRKERTLLTCITLVLLTFTVLSFTSVESYIRPNIRRSDGVAGYNGILLHLPTWDVLPDTAFKMLEGEYGRDYSVAPRAWYFGSQQGKQTFLNVKRAQRVTEVKAVAGLTPEEMSVTHADRALLKDADGKPVGRWFNGSDTYATLLPAEVADSLAITPSDVKKGAYVEYSGIQFEVIGILDSTKFDSTRDLDNESITPVDFLAMQSQNPNASPDAVQVQFKHLDCKTVLYLPFRTLVNMGGDLRSVAINFRDTATVKKNLADLTRRIAFNLYGGEDGVVNRFSVTNTTKSTGLINIIIPILIAALIVLNTMLGSVFERVKEIAIFSSIGLSPSNIAMLFIAEALVYAVIGAVSGYLIGQTLSKIISVYNILPGLYLNFSSTSAELSIGLVISVVLASTIFPARKASQVATPAVDRTWKVPDPDGDVWKIELPFAVTGAQAKGINGFLLEWFRSFEQQSVGDFLTQDVTTSTETMPQGFGYRLTSRIWLAPFDLGVSQKIQLDTVPTDLEGVFAVQLTIIRASGDISNWRRINRRFLNVLRRQYLIWRTLSAVERQHYLEAADANEPALALA